MWAPRNRTRSSDKRTNSRNFSVLASNTHARTPKRTNTTHTVCIWWFPNQDQMSERIVCDDDEIALLWIAARCALGSVRAWLQPAQRVAPKRRLPRMATLCRFVGDCARSSREQSTGLADGMSRSLVRSFVRSLCVCVSRSHRPSERIRFCSVRFSLALCVCVCVCVFVSALRQRENQANTHTVSVSEKRIR